jgi:hypothetical protein
MTVMEEAIEHGGDGRAGAIFPTVCPILDWFEGAK